ncbi:MAG: hypothetical protein ABNO52_00555 [Candidatus Shikimatogenerans sp. Tser]|uniref:Uncharacterized protein n=1 Tax=Candidatus Shikimatogenerans sp. Tser TaxID=3158568 RepID=A0AAU7QRD8_9FLAO
MKNININNKILLLNITKLEKFYKLNIFMLIKKILKRIKNLYIYFKKEIKIFQMTFFYKKIKYSSLKKKKKKFKLKILNYFKKYNNIINMVFKEFLNKKVYINIYK